MNIEIIYEEGVVERTEFSVLERTKFTKRELEELHAEVERYKLSVWYIFIPTKHVKAMMAIIRDTSEGEFGLSSKAPSETIDIGYLGHAWGAEYYQVDDLDAVYATTQYKLFACDGAVAKLFIVGDGND